VSVEGECLSQRGAMLADGSAVRPGIGDEEHNEIYLAVAALQLELPGDGRV